MDLKNPFTCRGCFWSCFLFFCLSFIPLEARLLSDGESRRVDRFVMDSLNCGRIGALNLALVREGQTILTKGYGMADERDGSRTTDSSVFCLSSLTEAFTALTLGKLLHRNDSYSWDTPVKEFLPDDFRLGNKEITNHATLRDLVSHRTGLAGADGIVLNKGMGPSELENRMLFMERKTGFRTKHVESRALFNLLQAALEKIGGKPWDMLIREHLLAPLDMTATKFLHEADPQYRKFAVPRMKVNGNLTHVPWEAVSTINLVGSSASLCSTAYDMAKWVNFLLQEGRNLRGHTVVRKEVLTELFQPVVPLDDSSDMKSNDFNQPGGSVSFTQNTASMTWQLGYYRGYKTVSKKGSLLGYESMITMIPSKRLGVFTSFTGQTGQKADVIKSLISLYAMDIMLSEEPWVDVPRICSTVDELVSSRPQPKQSYTRSYLRTDISPHRPLQAYMGSYGNGLYGRLEISVSNDTRNALSLIYGDLGNYRLFPTRNLDEFYMDAVAGPLWFTTRADEYIRWGPIIVSFNSSKQEKQSEPQQPTPEPEENEDGEKTTDESEEDEEDEDRITGLAIPSFDRTITPKFRRDFVLKQAFKEVKKSHFNECNVAGSFTASTFLLVLAISLNFLSRA